MNIVSKMFSLAMEKNSFLVLVCFFVLIFSGYYLFDHYLHEDVTYEISLSSDAPKGSVFSKFTMTFSSPDSKSKSGGISIYVDPGKTEKKILKRRKSRFISKLYAYLYIRGPVKIEIKTKLKSIECKPYFYELKTQTESDFLARIC
jgi:hypothetical protein